MKKYIIKPKQKYIHCNVYVKIIKKLLKTYDEDFLFLRIHVLLTRLLKNKNPPINTKVFLSPLNTLFIKYNRVLHNNRYRDIEEG